MEAISLQNYPAIFFSSQKVFTTKTTRKLQILIQYSALHCICSIIETSVRLLLGNKLPPWRDKNIAYSWSRKKLDIPSKKPKEKHIITYAVMLPSTANSKKLQSLVCLLKDHVWQEWGEGNILSTVIQSFRLWDYHKYSCKDWMSYKCSMRKIMRTIQEMGESDSWTIVKQVSICILVSESKKHSCFP